MAADSLPTDPGHTRYRSTYRQPVIHHAAILLSPRRTVRAQRAPGHFTVRPVLVAACCLGRTLIASAVWLRTWIRFPGFTEPYRRIQVACSETGIVATVDGQVGDRVQAGQTLATLESTEHRALLELAEHQMTAQGRLEAALAEGRLHQERLENMTGLAAQGYANQEELQRAHMESEVAEAHVRAAREDLVARALECRKIQAQLDNRTIRAPQNGVLVEILKKPGEFVSYNDPNVMRVGGDSIVCWPRSACRRSGRPP